MNEENAKKLLFAVGDALDNANVEYFRNFALDKAEYLRYNMGGR